MRALRQLVLYFNALPCVDGENVERGEGDRCAEGPIWHLEPQAIPKRRGPRSIRACSARGEGGLQRDVRVIGPIERALARPHDIDRRLSRTRGRMRLQVGRLDGDLRN